MTTSTGVDDECYVTIEVLTIQDQSHPGLAIVDATAPFQNYRSLIFNGAGLAINWGAVPTSTSVAQKPTYLGIALHAGLVFYLYTAGNQAGWQLLGSDARPNWMGLPHDAGSFFNYTVSGKTASFTNYNIKAITLADL